MAALYLSLLSIVGLCAASVVQQWRSSDPTQIPKLLKRYAGLGLFLGLLWLALKTPFWRHAFIIVSALIFACAMLPTEMTFFSRNPSLLVAAPYVAGFVAANYRRSGIGALASVLVIGVMTLASYRMIEHDPVTGPWLQGMILNL